MLLRSLLSFVVIGGALASSDSENEEPTCSALAKEAASQLVVVQEFENAEEFQSNFFINFIETMGFIDILEEQYPTGEVRRIHAHGFPYEFQSQNSINSLKPTSIEATNDAINYALMTNGLAKLLDQISSKIFVGEENEEPLSSNRLYIQNVTILAWVELNNEAERDYILNGNNDGLTLLIPLGTNHDISVDIGDQNKEVTRYDALFLGESHTGTLDLDESEAAVVLLLHLALPDGKSTAASSSTQQQTPLVANYNHDFEAHDLQPNVIEPVRWGRSHKRAAKGAYRMGLSPDLAPGILSYLREIGLFDTFVDLLYSNPLDYTKRTNKRLNLQDKEWFVERPLDYNVFDMVFFIPATHHAHNDFLKALGKAGFDQVLDAIGTYFGWDGITCVHLSLLGLSQSDTTKNRMHQDYDDTGGKAFNLLIPLIMPKESTDPELVIEDPNDSVLGNYKYRYNEGVMVGDEARHATRQGVNYRETNEYRFFASVYVADANATNGADVIPNYYMDGYPFHDPQIAVDTAGSIWKRDDPTVKLPK